MHLRPAAASDLPAVLALAERLADFALPPHRTAESIARADHRIIREQLERPSDDVLFIVAEDAGAVVGTIFANVQVDYFTGDHVAYVEVLAVSAAAAGRGVARRLMDQVEQWASARDLTRVDLTVFGNNTRAQGFYEHLGYAPELVRYVKWLRHPSTRHSQ